MKISVPLFARMIQPTSIWSCKVCISHRHVSYDFHDVTILLPTGWTKELQSVIRRQGLSYLLYAWLNFVWFIFSQSVSFQLTRDSWSILSKRTF